MQPNIRELSRQLCSGELRAEQLATERLSLAKTPSADGVFTALNENWIEQAKIIDQQRDSGHKVSPLAGVPVTLKDLYGVQGVATLAGSKSLEQSAKPELQDSDVVAELRRAGIIFAGRTNMSEFAFSGMGANPHFPRLTSVWDRETGRLPGGSSSGSAVSVALGIVPGTLGSDTAGSCRVPAAFNGIVGYKPTYGRLSLKGVYPLSPSSDAPGPLGVDVDSCFLLDYLMAGGELGGKNLPELAHKPVEEVRLLIPDGEVVNEVDDIVAQTFESAIEFLEKSGCQILRAPMQVMEDCVDMWRFRPVVPYEAWHHHREMIESRGELYDPFVRERARGGDAVSANDQSARLAEKAGLIDRFNADFATRGVDAVVYPTVGRIAPAFSEIENFDNMTAVNMSCLRNTATANYFDGCSISLPCHQSGVAPVGLMLSMPGGNDQSLFSLAAGIEQALKSR